MVQVQRNDLDGDIMKPFGVIYETTFERTGEKYIGQTTKTGKALDRYFGSGFRIRGIIYKYGVEEVSKEILCECYDKEELDEMEKYYIRVNNPELNISAGGDTSYDDESVRAPNRSREHRSRYSRGNR